MNKRIPDLTVIGITAEGSLVRGDNDREYTLVRTTMKTNSLEVPEISIPTVWNMEDIEGKSPEEISRLIMNLLENTQNSLGDMIEMYRGDGFYADRYDDRGNLKG